jgi:hypothetical protein
VDEPSHKHISTGASNNSRTVRGGDGLDSELLTALHDTTDTMADEVQTSSLAARRWLARKLFSTKMEGVAPKG